MRTVSRNMRLWWGSVAATFGRHRSRKNPRSGGCWKGLSIWARGFSALRSWRPGRSPRVTALALHLPWLRASAGAASSAAGNLFFSPSFSCRNRQAHSQMDTAGEKRIFPFRWWCAEVEGARPLSCRITVVVKHTETEHQFVGWRTPPSLIEKSWIGASPRFARRHDYTSTSWPTRFTMGLYNRYQIFYFFIALSISETVRDDSEKPTG